MEDLRFTTQVPIAQLRYSYLSKPSIYKDPKRPTMQPVEKYKATFVYSGQWLAGYNANLGPLYGKLYNDIVAQNLAKPGFRHAIKTLQDTPDADMPADAVWFSAKSSRKVPVGLADGSLVPMGEEDNQVYAGCLAVGTVTFAYYDAGGNVGITAYLNNIQKYADGERIVYNPFKVLEGAPAPRPVAPMQGQAPAAPAAPTWQGQAPAAPGYPAQGNGRPF